MKEKRFPRLNLPQAELRLSVEDGKLKVLDPLRRKYVALTPEEYVRQTFVAYLQQSLHYPAALMQNEVSLNLNGLARRCDTLVSDRAGRPWLVVEYKAPEVTVTQDVFDQIACYNLVLGARYLAVSNGMRHYCCKLSPETGDYQFIPSIPDWNEAHYGGSPN